MGRVLSWFPFFVDRLSLRTDYRMGACVSKPSKCVVGGLNLRRKGRRIGRPRRRTKTQSLSNKLSKVEPSHSTDLPHRNPTYQGTKSISPFSFSFFPFTLCEVRIMVGSSCVSFSFFELELGLVKDKIIDINLPCFYALGYFN